MIAHVLMVEIRDGFDVSTRSNIFAESNQVGSFTILPQLFQLVSYVSQLFVGLLHKFSKSMSGRFRSPARMIDRGILQLQYRMERNSSSLLEMLCSRLDVSSRIPASTPTAARGRQIYRSNIGIRLRADVSFVRRLNIGPRAANLSDQHRADVGFVHRADVSFVRRLNIGPRAAHKRMPIGSRL